MAIQVETWIPAIEQNLFKGLDVISNVCTDDSSYVNNKTIHIPNAGAPPSVSRGNTTYPVAITERTDTDVNYSLTNFEIGPVRLSWTDGLQLSYDKVASITSDFMGNLSETMRNYFLSQWYSYDAASIIDTTGTATTTNWLGSGATGSLKHLIGADVINAARIMDMMKMPGSDRYLLVDPVQWWQLIQDFGYTSARIGQVAGFPATIEPMFGFTVVQIPFVAAVAANTGGTVLIPAAADGSFTWAAANRPIALAVQKSAISWAKTEVKGWTSQGSGTFGENLEASTFGGSKYRRTDKKGVVAIRSVA
jgi:hypothetical protein